MTRDEYRARDGAARVLERSGRQTLAGQLAPWRFCTATFRGNAAWYLLFAGICRQLGRKQQARANLETAAISRRMAEEGKKR